MKSITLAFLLLITMQFSLAQNSKVDVSTTMLDTSHQVFIAGMDGWIFKEGDDAAWAKVDADISGWRKFKPTELSVANANTSGKVEGWFRLKIRLDSTFSNIPLGLMLGTWASSDVYVDGKFIKSFGSTGSDGKPYKEYNPYHKLPLPITLELNKEHIIAIHLVDYVTWYPLPKHLRGEHGIFSNQQNLARTISVVTPEYNIHSSSGGSYNNTPVIIVLTICSILCLLFWLLFYLNPLEKNLRLIAFFSTLLTAFALASYQTNTGNLLFVSQMFFVGLWNLSFWLLIGIIPVIISQLLLSKVFRSFQYFFAATAILGLAFCFFQYLYDPGYYFQMIGVFILTAIFLSVYCIIKAKKTIRGAQWSIVVGLLMASLFALLWSFSIGHEGNITGSISVVSFPLSLLVYVAIRFKEIIKEVRENAKQVVLISEEKRALLAGQNELLEKQVAERTSELNQSLQHLKSTQAQLIQSEKMASLGELTAGIAHEIQNPLNFVNNFSEVNTELIDELEQEVNKGNLDEVKAIAKDIKDNEQKINHHGKRADAIVKGMLQHSQSSSGKKEPTDINKLADEYFRLCYQGILAKDKSFNATLKTDFDETISNINIIPQDIGRVILNLITNAFYTIAEKKKQQGDAYEPIVYVSTKSNGDSVTILVRDNGNGIPEKVVDKIFQPFFTTKPTGQGTGLGLSLAYDIVKTHGGDLTVESKEGEGSEFVILLPV